MEAPSFWGFRSQAFSIMGAVKTTTMVVVVIPALVLGLPIFDTVFAIVRRVIRRQPIGRGDKEHLHHRILRAGYGQRRAVMIMYCISGLLGVMAVLYSRGLMVECVDCCLLRRSFCMFCWAVIQRSICIARKKTELADRIKK